jgi:ABC-2 type transport system ATP-binding protein
VTTHYLDEAEHCHRLAIIHAGRLAAIGTTQELKQVFASRPIVEILSAKPVDTMRVLDGIADVEKTSIFGTAVHAVLRKGAGDPEPLRIALRQSGLDIRTMTKIDDALSVALGDAPAAPDPEPAIPPPTAPARGNVGERLPS